MDADAVKNRFVGSRVWYAFIKQRPYDIIADPTGTLKGIFRIRISTPTRWLPTSNLSC